MWSVMEGILDGILRLPASLGVDKQPVFMYSFRMESTKVVG